MNSCTGHQKTLVPCDLGRTPASQQGHAKLRPDSLLLPTHLPCLGKPREVTQIAHPLCAACPDRKRPEEGDEATWEHSGGLQSWEHGATAVPEAGDSSQAPAHESLAAYAPRFIHHLQGALPAPRGTGLWLLSFLLQLLPSALSPTHTHHR